MDDVEVDHIRREELAKVESVRLLQELDVGGVGRSVSERDQHDTGDVDDLAVDLEDTSGGLHLRFETVRRSAEPG
jgi:hypothetical protein